MLLGMIALNVVISEGECCVLLYVARFQLDAILKSMLDKKLGRCKLMMDFKKLATYMVILWVSWSCLF